MRRIRPLSTLPAPSFERNWRRPARHIEDALAPAHRAGHLRHKAGADLRGIVDRRRRHIGDQRRPGRLDRRSRSAAVIASAAGCMRAQWNGAETGSASARLAPPALASSIARSTAALVPEMTTCPPPLSLAAWQTQPGEPEIARRLRGDRRRLRKVEPEEGGHRALAGRNRALHRVPRMRSSRAASSMVSAARGGTERNIRRANDRRRIAASRPMSSPASASSTRAVAARLDRHQRRLRVGGEGQFRLRALEHQSGTVSDEAASTRSNTSARGGKLVRERLPHTDRLRPLTRE